MTQEPVHWFVLGGGLSPYTLQLWEMVANRSNHSVTLAHIPRPHQPDFVHEGNSVHSDRVEIIPIQSARDAFALGIQCSRMLRTAIVCMGHSPIYNILISAFIRTRTRNRGLVFYMSDTNGTVLAEHAASAICAGAALMAKRLVLGSIFNVSLDLGFSNALAHRILGIRNGIEIPLLAVEFPASMEADLPEPLVTLVQDLPRPRLLTVARLVECKNIQGLVKAFTAATRVGMPGSLTIVGEGTERSLLLPLLSHVQGRVILAGAVPFGASRRIFGAFDGMVLPSVSEAWGIAIVEALGWGIPVLSSWQCGAGVSMALKVGSAIKLCGTSQEEMRSSLLDFVNNLEYHTAAAKATAPLVRQKFGMNQVADALISLGKTY
jgi:glycosyltransferase involved in cell wall biosynthesis